MKMRIVALTRNVTVVIQIYNEKKYKWEQINLTCEEFESFMKEKFPQYYHDYEVAETDKSVADFFYYYGETPRMISRGESYVYE